MSTRIFNWMRRNGRAFFFLTLAFAVGHTYGRHQVVEQTPVRAAVSDAAQEQMIIRVR